MKPGQQEPNEEVKESQQTNTVRKYTGDGSPGEARLNMQGKKELHGNTHNKKSGV